MTAQDIINWFSTHPNLILAYFITLIILSLIGLLLVNESNYKSPINYVYTGIIYAITIPGLLSFILLLYSFFFLKTNLLQVDLLMYFTPIVAMIITLVIVNKTVPMSKIPGFNRLSGLFILVIITFIITYILQRMFFGVFFIGKFQYLILFFIILLISLKFAWNKITR